MHPNELAQPLMPLMQVRPLRDMPGMFVCTDMQAPALVENGMRIRQRFWRESFALLAPSPRWEKAHADLPRQMQVPKHAIDS